MTRSLQTLILLACTLPFGFATGAQAQDHDHQHADDTSRAMPMDHDGMMQGGMMPDSMMQAMMQMHERMMADSAMHRRMMADPAMRQMMAQMMGGEMDTEQMRERMAEMTPEARQQRMQEMHARMKARMEAMTPGERQQMMEQMMEMHQKMMADPEMHERMMADPEMRRMMERMMPGGQMEGMERDGMEGMDHGQMEGHEGMDHSGMDHDSMERSEAGADEEAAARTADRFRQAVAAGDRAAVEALLLPNAVILEGGGSETRSEYLGGHFASDGAFLSAMERTPLTRRTETAGDAAWVASTSRLAGTYEGRTLDLDSAELLVLRRDASAPEGWRIAAVHWSSRPRE